jgi:hypothetical protein
MKKFMVQISSLLFRKKKFMVQNVFRNSITLAGAQLVRGAVRVLVAAVRAHAHPAARVLVLVEVEEAPEGAADGLALRVVVAAPEARAVVSSRLGCAQARTSPTECCMRRSAVCSCPRSVVSVSA